MRVLMLLLSGILVAARQGQPMLDLPAGLTPQQVRDRLGAPTHISRQVIAHRCIEQWHYGAPHHRRLVFDVPRGQVPRLVEQAAGP